MFWGILLSAEGLGAEAPKNSKAHNRDLQKFIFSFKHVWVSCVRENVIILINYQLCCDRGGFNELLTF